MGECLKTFSLHQLKSVIPNGMMSTQKKSRRVLITGAAGVLGQKVCEVFLNHGDQVIGTYIDALPQDMSPQTQAQIHWLKLDVSDSAQVRRTLEGLDVDVCIHCAGGFRFSYVDQLSDQDFDFLLNSNLKSSFYIARELIPVMKKKNYGRLLLISSKSTLNPGAGMAAYCATKSAINSLVQSLADEVKKYDIQVNAVLPTIIDTPTNRKDMPQAEFSTWVKPEELADVIYDLTTEKRKAIHGALIPISGRV